MEARYLLSDMSVMLGRSMRHIFRSMDTIIKVALMPILFMLLFVYVFGGAIQSGTGNYVNYLLPGILLIAIASGIAYTAYRLFLDVQKGIFERFHSMPIAHSAVLWGHVLTSLVSNAISLVVIVLVALLMGFRSPAGILSWLAVIGILALFTLALTWIAAIAGLSAKTIDGASAFSFPLLFLPFISSAFVPTGTHASCCPGLRGKPTGNLDCRRNTRAAVQPARRERHLDCHRVVCRDHSRGLCLRDAGL